MEGLTAKAYKGVTGYWMRRRGYEKLNGSGGRRRKRVVVVEELAAVAPEVNGSRRSRRRFWRIKVNPRLKLLKLRLRFSPKKFILGLRDAYVNMMNKLANSRFINSSGVGVGLGAGYTYPAGDGINGFGVRPLKEYDQKMIIEIYKSLVIAQTTHPLVNPKLPTPLPTVTEC